jgi:zinc-finger of transposase IS204/IS1001/IS1096/IS1165
MTNSELIDSKSPSEIDVDDEAATFLRDWFPLVRVLPQVLTPTSASEQCAHSPPGTASLRAGGVFGGTASRGRRDRVRGRDRRGDRVRLGGLRRCGRRAEAQDRMPVEIRDLACFGRPARLVWHKRRWRCVDTDCESKTWTEHSAHVSAPTVLTRRAGVESCRQVGQCDVAFLGDHLDHSRPACLVQCGTEPLVEVVEFQPVGFRLPEERAAMWCEPSPRRVPVPLLRSRTH